MEIIEKIDELSKILSLICKTEGRIEKKCKLCRIGLRSVLEGEQKGYRWRRRGWKNTRWRESAEAIEGKDDKFKKKKLAIFSTAKTWTEHKLFWSLRIGFIKNLIKRWITPRPWTVLISEVWFKKKKRCTFGEQWWITPSIPRDHWRDCLWHTSSLSQVSFRSRVVISASFRI